MPEPSRRARVVVVDDSRFHREFARQVLQDEADVECCEDAEQTLGALEREPADLILQIFTFDDEPSIFPSTPYETFGCEDARITCIEDPIGPDYEGFCEDPGYRNGDIDGLK